MKTNEHKPRWIYSVAIAIAVHVFIIWLFGYLFFEKHQDKTKKKTKYTVVRLMKTKPSHNTSGKTDTKHLSTSDQKVKKETVNRDKKVSEIVKGSVIKSKQPTKTVRNNKIRHQTKKIKHIRQKSDKNKLKIAKKPVKPQKNNKPNDADKKNIRIAQKSSNKTTKKIKLVLSQDEISKILGIPTRKELLTEIASGKHTMLNSRKWVGAAFFLRVREAIAQTWNPGPVYRSRDPQGDYYGFKNWFTSLKITLDAKGNLVRVYILQPSGLRFLDLEAVRAVKAAAPFLNPPKEIVNPRTGKFSFRFGFIVEVNKNISFKMFRY